MATPVKREERWQHVYRHKAHYATGTFARKSEAIAWWSQVDYEVNQGLAGAIPNDSVSHLLDRYLDEISPRKRGHAWEKTPWRGLKNRPGHLCCSLSFQRLTWPLGAS